MTENSAGTPPRKGPPLWLGWALFIGSGIGVVIMGALAMSIMERRAERTRAQVSFVQPIADWEADNSKWGVSFPREFNSWEATRQMAENTKYGGSSYRDLLKESPALVILWAGYPFAKGYNQARGHYNSINDVLDSKRINENSPATCWTCKSPDVPRLMAQMGPGKFYAGKLDDLRNEVKNPIGCADCHDNKTMALRISRPALVEAFKAQGKDIRKATHQEMRSLVCAQCHVEYYFKKGSNYLTFPWSRGRKAENMEQYYKENPHSDWTHAISGAKMIKMQHPDFEVYEQGVHSFRKVSCADCHMPYRVEGGVKYTDHQIRSPLYMTENACQTCHRWSDKDIRSRVYSMQDKNKELLTEAEKALSAGHLEIGEAVKRGATEAELAKTRDLISKSQMYWDYVAAANGMGFHAPQECARILGKAISLAQQSRLETTRILAKRGALDPVSLPDISTVPKAQEYIKPYVSAQAAALEKAKQDKAAAAEAGDKARANKLKTQ